MADPEFRRSQEMGIRLPHVAPINALVDELRSSSPDKQWMPYVAPLHGGIDARMMNLLRDPGPMTHSGMAGSGFLCVENDDPAAERFLGLMTEAGISPGVTIPWNAYPWYINRKPMAAELDAGVQVMRRLLPLLPVLQVVMLNGREAQEMWRRFAARHPAELPDVVVLSTYHTANQAFIGTADVRAARMANLRSAFAAAALHLRKS